MNFKMLLENKRGFAWDRGLIERTRARSMQNSKKFAIKDELLETTLH
jgi:hypothetical protein